MKFFKEPDILIADFYDILLAKYYGVRLRYKEGSVWLDAYKYSGKLYVTDVKYLEE